MMLAALPASKSSGRVGRLYLKQVHGPVSYLGDVPLSSYNNYRRNELLTRVNDMKFYDQADMAELLKTDESSILAMSMRGEIPEPHYIGGRIVRWVEFDLHLWVEGGCEVEPPTLGRDDWTELRQANRREFLEKYQVADAADKRIAADAVADRRCNKTDCEN